MTATAFCFLLLAGQSQAALPPVRIAVVPGGGSGMEQDVVDRITSQLQDNPSISLSTVNPEWYVVCNITENLNQASGSIRYNGTVIIKTVSGQVLNTVATQKYNQDFSLNPGAPMNKALVDGAAKDVIASLSQRALGPIQEAVVVEMDTRDHLIKAAVLGDQGKYKDAIETLHFVTPESPHFKTARQMIDQFTKQWQIQQTKHRHH